MEDSTQGTAESAVEALRDFLRGQLEKLDDPGNVHAVRETLYGRRWAEELETENLPDGLEATVSQQVERAWNALSRYPWDLYGAQQALKNALDLTTD